MALRAIVSVVRRPPFVRAFKTRAFARWAGGEGLTDAVLVATVAEMERGLVDAHLGGQVVNKRVALPGRGKRGGARTLVAFRQGFRAFFVFGFAKRERGTVSDRELTALKLLAKELLTLSAESLARAIDAGALIEIGVDGKNNQDA